MVIRPASTAGAAKAPLPLKEGSEFSHFPRRLNPGNCLCCCGKGEIKRCWERYFPIQQWAGHRNKRTAAHTPGTNCHHASGIPSQLPFNLIDITLLKRSGKKGIAQFFSSLRPKGKNTGLHLSSGTAACICYACCIHCIPRSCPAILFPLRLLLIPVLPCRSRDLPSMPGTPVLPALLLFLAGNTVRGPRTVIIPLSIRCICFLHGIQHLFIPGKFLPG